MFSPQHEGDRQHDEIREHGHEPVEPGEDAVELQALPGWMFAVEIEIERFVVRTVAEVMTEMTLRSR